MVVRMQKLFSVIIVCLNPGEKLELTLKSVEKQTFQNYEIIVKDGLSTDGSLNYAGDLSQRLDGRTVGEQETGPVLKLVSQKDCGIYDAMNQAVREASGRYVYFLNAGDYFYADNVLQEMACFIEKKGEEENQKAIFYGNIFERITKQEVHSNPSINAFGCYRNVPCHQACFYSRELLLTHPFELQYKVRADYEQFLWCYFRAEAVLFYKDMLVADYEGGGFSETKQNRKLSAKEHQEIVKIYLSKGQVFKYKAILWLTLAPLRTALAENPKTAGFYNALKGAVYIKK